MKKEKIEITKYNYKKDETNYFIYVIPSSGDLQSVDYYIQKEYGTLYRIVQQDLTNKNNSEEIIANTLIENIENIYNTAAGYVCKI